MKIGLDIGSTTIKAVVLNEAGEIVFRRYERHRAQIAMLCEVLLHAEQALTLMQADFPAVLNEYRALCITLGRQVQASGGADVRGEAIDINESGELIVRDEAGAEHTLRTADVSVRGVMGYV